ncbi:hypothetical protein [Streptomyces sp. RK9]|uniref:hypothetical protein n=1 Tax=Streptomyces sp. RK9 TaxID=3239284 RepID=UPI0038703635
MRRTAAVILGTAALLGALATPASAATPGGGLVGVTAESLVATVKNLVTGVEVTVDNVLAAL